MLTQEKESLEQKLKFLTQSTHLKIEETSYITYKEYEEQMNQIQQKNSVLERKSYKDYKNYESLVNLSVACQNTFEYMRSKLQIPEEQNDNKNQMYLLTKITQNLEQKLQKIEQTYGTSDWDQFKQLSGIEEDPMLRHFHQKDQQATISSKLDFLKRQTINLVADDKKDQTSDEENYQGTEGLMNKDHDMNIKRARSELKNFNQMQAKKANAKTFDSFMIGQRKQKTVVVKASSTQKQIQIPDMKALSKENA